MTLLRATLFSLLISSTGVHAADVVFGVGLDDLDSSGDTASFQLEIHSDPIHSFRWGDLSRFAVLQVDTDRDVFAGVGFSVLSELSQRWFLEGSLAAGLYDFGSSGNDLGGHVQIRSLVGVGYRLTDTSSVSIAIDHLSNGGLRSRNPGRETLSIRYRRSF